MIKLETENLYQSAEWAKQGHSYAMWSEKSNETWVGKKKKKARGYEKKRYNKKIPKKKRQGKRFNVQYTDNTATKIFNSFISHHTHHHHHKQYAASVLALAHAHWTRS